MTPQPPSNTVPTTSVPGGKPGTPAPNGTEKASDNEAGKTKASIPVAERKPATALFISYADNEQHAKEAVAEEDREKTKGVVRLGGKFPSWKVQFETHEIAQAALTRAQAMALNQKKENGRGPKVMFFEEKAPTYHQRDRESQGGAGTWQGSGRGASAAGGITSGRGGYQSGGASDSEGGRGRGGFRGRGRGRGGDDRGGRGGRGGGRGSYQGKTTDGASDNKAGESKLTEAKPAATSGDS
jgi:hypothetical protein